MSRSTTFAIQLTVTAIGALLDYLVGRLTSKLSLGIISWAALTLLAAAALDMVRDAWRDRRTNGYGRWRAPGAGLTRAAGVIRGRMDLFRWTTVVNAVIVATLAGIASYAFTLAALTFRFLAVKGGPELGKLSPYDHPAITFISDFQSSSAAAWLIVTTFVIALILRAPVVLPLGVIAVSVVNAALIAIPALTQGDPGLQSQLSSSLSIPDGWLLLAPPPAVLYACSIPFGIGILLCGAINRNLS